MTLIEASLRCLMTRGYHFLHPRNAVGAVVTVLGFRAHHNVIDLVQIFGENDADAVRMPNDEPDMLAPHKVLWRRTGPPCQVIESILALPDPDETAPPESCETDSKGLWVPVRPGRSKWLATSV